MSPILTQILYTLAVTTVFVVVIEVVIGWLRPTARGAPSMALGVGLAAFAALVMYVDANPRLLERANNLLEFDQRQLVWRSLCGLGGAIFVIGALGVRLSRAVEKLASGNAAKRDAGQPDQEKENARELARSLVQNSISGVMVLKAVRNQHRRVMDFECRIMNQEAEQLLGRSAKTLLGQSILKHLPCLEEKKLIEAAVSVVETKLPFREERRINQGDRDRWYNIAIAGHGDGVVVSFEDVTGRKKSEQQLRHAAEHDALTGLPSRTRLSERIEQAISRAKRVPEYKFAVLFLDFDRFKIINDSLGHDVGDQLLISISERLRANLRDIDTPSRLGQGHLPARLGGDEFVVLLDGITSVRGAVIVAERLQEALSEPHVLDGHEVISTASIGIVTSDGDYESPDDILRDADTAMYEAKNSGKARHIVFDKEMHSEVMQRLQLEKELRVAAENLDFTLVYQPIVDLENAQLAGFEALLRWPHAERGLVLPLDFVPLAEELGLIVPIGKWVIEEATRQLVAWQQKPGGSDLWMSVNLSRHQLVDPEMVDHLRRVLRETGASPRSLILEVTESAIMAQTQDLKPVLAALQKENVQLAMDDFGTGHSSLGFLHRVAMHILKIDRSFINRVENLRGYGAIIQSVVQLAHNLDLKVVAEGIESGDQLAMLLALDCNYGQGFLFSPALEPAEAEKFLDPEHRFRIAA